MAILVYSGKPCISNVKPRESSASLSFRTVNIRFVCFIFVVSFFTASSIPSVTVFAAWPAAGGGIVEMVHILISFAACVGTVKPIRPSRPSTIR